MNILLTAGFFAAATLAIAQTSMQPEQRNTMATPAISERAARDIAWSHGLVHVEEVLLLEDRWEIAGRDRSGEEFALDIDARNGRLLGDPRDLAR